MRLMGDGIGSGLSSMSVCFDFRRTANIGSYDGLFGPLSSRNSTLNPFRCHHPLIIQLSYFLFNFSDETQQQKRCKVKHQKCIIHLCMMYVCMRAKKSAAKSMMVNCSTLTEITWCLDQFVHTIFRLRHYELNSFFN